MTTAEVTTRKLTAKEQDRLLDQIGEPRGKRTLSIKEAARIEKEQREALRGENARDDIAKVEPSPKKPACVLPAKVPPIGFGAAPRCEY